MKLLPLSKWRIGGFHKEEVIIGLLFCLLLIPVLRNISAENDLDIFYAAAQELRFGTNPYDGPQMYGMWYYYSPLFASLLAPLTFLPVQVLKAVWMLVGFAMLNRIYVVMREFLQLQHKNKETWLLIAMALLGYNAVFLNLLYGQLTILIVWCCLEGARLMNNDKKPLGGLVYSLGINIKILPVFFFWYYLLKKDWKAMLFIGLGIALLILIPFLYLPADFHAQLIKDWLGLLNPINKEHVNTVGEGGFTDFASLLTRYFTNTSIRGEGNYSLAALSTRHIFLIQWIFRLVVVICCGWMMLRFLPKRFSDKALTYAGVSFFLACIPVAFPHQRDYSVLMCFPATTLMLHSYIVAGYRPKLWILSLSFISLLLMGSVVFSPLLPWPVRHFLMESRTPGLGMLLFLPVWIVWFCRYTSKPLVAAK
jgi:hypothetical protein